MASYINIFLKTEITVIPRLLDKYIGKYYNNTLCNGAAWMFLSWYLLHVVFDDLLNALLRRMKYKEYLRIRLKRSLWYLDTTFSIINYLLISLPLLGYPLLKEFSPSVSILLSLLLTWLTLEICGSVLFKAVLHWVSHKDKLRCDKDIFECSLFPPRNDATYNFLILRREIKEREEK
ncbi:uncharacterized protein BDFB_007220 [Asbolus verrucosus]|uniref:Uncharacterized protein n=1 Tax=Asbolus verrucosus TaxID=1661398 RepID=A0A482VQX8_ASBVE|nr:uncharacterized protein BDFB_007220 [Asbolus verrucosus]